MDYGSDNSSTDAIDDIAKVPLISLRHVLKTNRVMIPGMLTGVQSRLAKPWRQLASR